METLVAVVGAGLVVLGVAMFVFGSVMSFWDGGNEQGTLQQNRSE